MTRILLLALILFTSCLPSLVSAQVTAPESRLTSDFDNWRGGFRVKALAAGISGAMFDDAFRGVRYTPQTLEVDESQPEFVRPIWNYLDDAVSKNRISDGRTKSRELRTTLRNIENRYGVDSKILLAIWGMESNYGAFRGTTYTIEALANAAITGRRRSFAETELIAALKILSRGDATPSIMLGGWSGAMGHTQFMPSTYLRYAVDHDLNGHRDVWSDDPIDALASTANYLQQLGWKLGQTWGIEVILPNGFDYALTGEFKTHSANFWSARGVMMTNGRHIPSFGTTAILLPAGAEGPVFAIFPNFQILRQYNKSISYVIAVGHLADRIDGRALLKVSWPRGDPPMTRASQREIQVLLIERGFDVGVIDGMIGPKTSEAIQAFQRSIGMLADGYATVDLINLLRP